MAKQSAQQSSMQLRRQRFLHSDSYKKLSVIFLPVLLISILMTLYFARSAFATIQGINEKSEQLRKIDNYDVSLLRSNPLTRDAINSIVNGSVSDIIDIHNQLSDEVQRYQQHIQKLQQPYHHFLQHIYLPSLNIRKNQYTQYINTNLMGLAFLEANPFNDIQLLKTWSDFFKYVGENDEFNEISDLKVGDVEEMANGLYSIPITVSFTSPSKRAFLLLVDKLSLTSNQANISLLNEFFYHLWEQIKQHKTEEISTIIRTEIENAPFRSAFMQGEEVSIDKVIGYSLSRWIFENSNSTLIDDDILDQTIKQMVICANNEPQEICYFRFRDKMRSLSSFAYVIGSEALTNKVEKFRDFMKVLPAVISIDRFTFDKLQSTISTSVTASDKRYIGRISMRVYGRGISNEEIQEIAQALGNICSRELQNIQPISVEFAIQRTEDTVRQLSNMTIVNQSRTQDLLEIRSILDEIQKSYPSLTNYNKAIRTFEIYRMMSDVGLCR